MADTIKPTAKAAVTRLRDLGLHPVLLTGDNERAARAVADQVGIDDVIAGVDPVGKLAAIKRLQASRRTVAMVGDGVNDAAALAQADLGLAMGTGTDAAIEAADLTLVGGDPRAVADAITLSRKTLATIKGNLGWAFGYNAAALPLAASGLLNPVIAAAAMAFSSVFVVTNSLRLRRFNQIRLIPNERAESARAPPECRAPETVHNGDVSFPGKRAIVEDERRPEGASMKTKAAVVYEPGKPIEIEELDLDGPRDGEVLIRYTYAGLCHSDVHVQHGDLEARLPMVLGHEGAGIVEEVGPGVTRVAPGDHVVCSFIPNCGICRYCATGRQSICDMGATILEGYLPGERFPISGPRGQYGAMCMLGTFSQYGVIHQNSAVKVDDDLPLDKAVLVGCGVPTGFGSAVNTAKVRAGDTVAVYGVGGIGINAVQGARYAGAKYVVAIDPLENKRAKALELGATHAFATAAEAQDVITSLTRGQGADSAIITVGLVDADVVTAAFTAVGKGGIVVITGLNKLFAPTIQLPGTILTLFRKSVVGSLFGDCNPTTDIPRILGLYQSGDIKLDEIITRTYTLDEVNEGYDDLLNGKNVRGIIVHEH